MTAKKRVLFVFSLVATVLALAVVPFSQVSAVDLDIDVTTIWTGRNPSSVLWVTSDGNNYNTFVCGGGTDYRTRVSVLSVNLGDVSSVIRTGDIIVLSLSGTSDGNANVNIDFARELYDRLGNFEIIDIKYSQAGQSAMGVDIYLMASKNNVSTVDIIRAGGYAWFTMQNMNGTECMAVGNWAAYRPTGNGSQAIVDAINNNNSTQSINDAKSAIVGAINEQKQAQEQANSDANDRYNDEKDTISGNGDDAQASADSLDIGFNVPNPFLNWFALFTDNACVSIPTIASWLHTNETNVCSPWRNTGVREVATPIMGVLGGTILLGFLVRWLKGSDFDKSIEVS